MIYSIAVSCGETKSNTTTIPSTKSQVTIESPTINIKDCGYKVSQNHGADWKLIFQDQFEKNYDDLWIAWQGGAYNDELQHYQKENVFIKDGFLVLQAKRESVVGQTLPNDKKQKSFDFTSGRLESKQLFGPKNKDGQRAVKFSARLKLVEGEGMWPAWWSYGNPWPTQGEIDILEARGHTPAEFSSCFHYGKQPSIPDTKPALNEFHFEYPEPLTDCFHVYEMEWTETSFKIFFDEKLVKVYDVAKYPYVEGFWEKEHMLCLNLAVGGNFFKRVDHSKIPDEAFYVIDWVKVFQK